MNRKWGMENYEWRIRSAQSPINYIPTQANTQMLLCFKETSSLPYYIILQF